MSIPDRFDRDAGHAGAGEGEGAQLAQRHYCSREDARDRTLPWKVLQELAVSPIPGCEPASGRRLATAHGSHPDYYASAQAIAVRLFERGEFDWSREIEDAIEGGSTATEILMRIRFVLQRLLLSGEASDSETVAANSLIVQLNGVLS
jgi:hypothetical protein